MLVKQYEHRLPADYDMRRIRDRAARLGPMWDDTAGLCFKAFLARERGQYGATANAYASFYLWNNSEAALDFITGDGFRSVIDSFGRPQIETWLLLDLVPGRADAVRSVRREDTEVHAGDDLAVLKAVERERNRALGDHDATWVAIVALDVSSWRLSRFILSAEEPRAETGGAAYEVLHLASPARPLSRSGRAAKWRSPAADLP